MPDRTTYELDLTGRLTPDLAGEDLLDAVDAASDQDRTTWLVDGGKRIAKITPVDEIPDDIFGQSGRDNPHLALLRARLPEDGAAFRQDRDRLLFPGQVQQMLREDGAAFRRSDLAGLLSDKRRETEPVFLMGQLLGMLQSVARQVEEVHRTLGLERDDDGTLVSDTPMLAEVMAGQVETLYHGLGFCGDGDFGDDPEDEDEFGPDMDDGDDPLGPPWYGKRDEIAARLTSGDLILLSRDLLLQVLEDAGLVAGVTGYNGYETVWETLRDLAGMGYQAQAADPGPKMTPRDRPVTTGMLADILSLAGVVPSAGVLAEWTYSQRVIAYDWAVREHLNASDNPVPRVPRPAFITGEMTR